MEKEMPVKSKRPKIQQVLYTIRAKMKAASNPLV